MKRAGLRWKVPTFDPCLFFIFRGTGGAVSEFTTHIGDIPGCGEPEVLPKVRDFSEERFVELKLQGSPFVRVGMDLAQGSDFSVTLAPDCSAGTSIPLPPSLPLWADQQKTLSVGDIKLRQ